MLQIKPIGNRSNACSLEPALGEFRDSGVEDRGSRFD